MPPVSRSELSLVPSAVDLLAGSLSADSPADTVPFAIRLTADQIEAAAEDADFRAQILADVASALDGRISAGRRIPERDHVLRRVTILRAAAIDLRVVASRLIDDAGGVQRVQ